MFTPHHASTANPYISYPFLVANGLHELAERIHAEGGLFKAYYTIRELSTLVELLPGNVTHGAGQGLGHRPFGPSGIVVHRASAMHQGGAWRSRVTGYQ